MSGVLWCVELAWFVFRPHDLRCGPRPRSMLVLSFLVNSSSFPICWICVGRGLALSRSGSKRPCWGHERRVSGPPCTKKTPVQRFNRLRTAA